MPPPKLTWVGSPRPIRKVFWLVEVAGVAVCAPEQHGHLLVPADRLPADLVAFGDRGGSG